MDTYVTFRGTSRRRTPAANIYSLPHREAPDDGRIIVHAGSSDGAPCPDCGRGHLRWAEAEREQERMAGMIVVPCCWARRARIYAGR